MTDSVWRKALNTQTKLSTGAARKMRTEIRTWQMWTWLFFLAVIFLLVLLNRTEHVPCRTAWTYL